MTVLNVSKLEKPPRLSDLHLWADYIELLCLVNIDHTISKADIIDRVLPVQELDETISGIDDETVEASRPEYHDKVDQRANDWFSYLNYRAGAFGKFYPFYVDDSSNLCRHEELTLAQKLYIFFLLSSSLRCVEKQAADNMTNIFEVASLIALKACLPRSGRAYLFGSMALNKGRYSGKAWGKIVKLAQDIRVGLNCTEDQFSPHDTGDKGLDLVGWVPMGDISSGLLLAFGQCACSPNEWDIKQLTSSAMAWSSKLNFHATSKPINMVFVPLCYRRPDGDWFNSLYIYETTMIDRLRLVHLLREKYTCLRKLIVNLVDEATAQTETIF